MTSLSATVHGLGAALGCGLLIGIERERRKGSGPRRAFVGVRSFALVSSIGAFSALQGGALVLLAGALVLGLSLISHWRERSDDPGVTTELALFLSFLLGVNAIAEPSISAGAAVIVAALLNLRGPLHHFARVSLRGGELRDALTLAGAALIVYPLLPDAGSSWLLGINPHRMWGLVVVILSLQGIAHIALRITGPTLGLALTGFASGFVSSTATTAAMGQRYRAQALLLAPCAAAALLSNVATYLMLLVVTLTIAPGQLPHLAASLGSALLATLLVAGLGLRAAHAAPSEPAPPGRAFSVRQALLFSFILSAATAMVTYANAYLGRTAATIGAMLAGLADVHAAASSILSLAASGALGPSDLLFGFLLALSANTASKLTAAGLGGGWHFLARVGPGLLLILLAAWLPFIVAQH
ncbi:MAG: DUF4010 domain-containing protein [Pseudomonadota bacterium]